MATKSQRTRQTTALKGVEKEQPFHELLNKALRALWELTGDDGVRKGNGKQTILVDSLKVTKAQADHINNCLCHLGLLSWNGKRGLGSEYKVDPNLAKITPEQAAQALEVVGSFPKAKPATKRRTPARKQEAEAPKSPQASPNDDADKDLSVIDPDGPNYFDRLVEQNHRMRTALAEALETIDQQRHQIGELTVQVDKLTGRLGHYENGSSDIEKLLADGDALLARTS